MAAYGAYRLKDMPKQKRYRCIIVDDEKSQQEVLYRMIEKHFPALEIVMICNNVKNGVNAINELKPDLIFLDVLMPPETGFDLLTKVDEINFEVVFVTSYEKFAIDAFKVSAVDYILKPFGVDALKAAIEKFEQRILVKNSFSNIQLLLHNVNTNIASKTKIALPTREGFMYVEIGNISHCISDNAYTTFYFADKTSSIICKSLGEFEEMMKGLYFVRIHKSCMINLSFLKEYIRGDGGQVRMIDGTVLNVSRNHKDDLLRLT